MATKKQFPLAVVIGAVDKISAPLLRIQKKINRFMRPIRRLQASISRLTRAGGFRVMGAAIGRVTKSMGVLGKELIGVAGRLAALGGAAAGFAAKMVVDFAKVGDAAAKTGKAVGLSAQEVQEWEFIADRSGVSQSVLNSSLIAFSKRLGEAKAGTGGLFTMLKKTNPELLKQLQTTEDTSEAMNLYLGFIGSMTDESKQAALAAAGFSRSGVKMTNVAKEGADGIEALRKEANKLGLVISNDSAAASETFVDKLTNMKAALTGVRNIIGSALMPVLQDLIERFTAFIVENRGAIEKWAKAFAASIPPFDVIRQRAGQLVEAIKPLIKFLGWLVDNLGVVKAAVLAMSVVLGGKLVVAILALIPAIKAFGIALLTTPIGWFMAAVAALAGAALLIYRNWDGIASFFTSRWQAVREAFDMGWLRGIWELIQQFNPFALLRDALFGLIEAITGVDLGAIVSDMFGGMTDAAGKVVGFFLNNNPFTFWLRSLDKLIERFTGFDVGGMISNITGGLFGSDKEGATVDQAGSADKTRIVDDIAGGQHRDYIGRRFSASRDERPALMPNGPLRNLAGINQAAPAEQSQAKVTVDFSNLPRGARVTTDKRSTADLDVGMGFSMVPGA